MQGLNIPYGASWRLMIHFHKTISSVSKSIRYDYIPKAMMILSLIFVFTNAYSQQDKSSFTKKIISSFYYKESIPNEKLYLHTDKSCYLSGDTIWMKAYLVDAISHKPQTLSKYVYVELINRKDQVIQRKKFGKRPDGTIPGLMSLPNNIEEGDYYLRAYTHWMNNCPRDYFFYKNIKIKNKQQHEIRIDIKYEENKGNRIARVCFRQGYNFLKKCNVSYMVRTKLTGNSFLSHQTDEYGEIKINIPPKKDLKQYIYVVLEDHYGMKHRHTFYVPEVFDFHVDFFPEGGDLIARTIQKIAFKAIGSDGNSVPVHGHILNTNGDTITSFKSDYKGIGTFMLNTNEGEQYRAVLTTEHQEKVLKKTFPLPASKTDAHALSITTHNNKAYYKILSFSAVKGNFYLVGQMRGHLMFVTPVIQGQGVLDTSSLPNGILSLTLLDEDMIPYSERLLFIYHPRTICEVNINNKASIPEGLCSFDLSLSSKQKLPVQGDFSLSVSDARTVNVDSTDNNIISQLLMTSELHGNIESPGYYFKNDRLRNPVLIDNLLLTQGWTRYRTKDIIKEKKVPLKYFAEAGQTVSGTVMTGTNKPASNSQVLIKIQGKTYPPVQTDSNGHFILNNVSFTDTTFVEAFVPEKGKLLRSSITIDRDFFPVVSNRNTYYESIISSSDKGNAIKDNSIKGGDGVKELTLPELTIIAKSFVKEKFSSFKMNDEEMIRQQNAKTALDLIQKVPGFQIINNRPYLNPKQSLRPEMRMSTDVKNRETLRPTGKNNYGKTVRFVLDNKSVPFNMLSLISAEDIVSIHKIDPEVDAALGYAQNHAALEEAYLEALENGATLEELDEMEYDQQIRSFKDGDFRTSGGCIILTSRKGNMRLPKNDSRGDEAFLLGYSKYKDFYVPKYNVSDTKKIRLERSTVYWQPKLIFDDNGNAHVDIYTFKNYPSLNFVLEGITKDGNPCHYEWIINN